MSSTRKKNEHVRQQTMVVKSFFTRDAPGWAVCTMDGSAAVNRSGGNFDRYYTAGHLLFWKFDSTIAVCIIFSGIDHISLRLFISRHLIEFYFIQDLFLQLNVFWKVEKFLRCRRSNAGF